MEEEQRFVVETFTKSFYAMRDREIVLYGVGKNTEAIVTYVTGFQFLGLMDPKRTGERIYGYPVLSEAEVISRDVKNRIIVIVARDSVINIIFKRIESLLQSGIQIFDYKGTDLSKREQATDPADIPYWDASYESLCVEIDRHDVISFDIFDTLLARRVLEPTDIFALTERALQRHGYSFSFTKLRAEAEKNLQERCPNFDEIYAEMVRLFPDEKALAEAKALEWETDSSSLFPRKVVVDALHYAVSQGKKVYLLSDMYYSSEALISLLAKNGIDGYRAIYVSNELRMTKEDGAAYRKYWELVAPTGQEKLLHIGDNRRADIERAKAARLDTFQVYSGLELLTASSMQGLLSNVGTLTERCILGLLVAELFSDPFVLGKTRGNVTADQLQALGYAFLGPLLTEFTRWMDWEVKRRDAACVLFPSRDGYLIHQLYHLLSEEPRKNFYFRTSRRAVTVAALKNREDLAQVAKRNFQGTYLAFFETRFGVTLSEDEPSASLSIGEERETLLPELLRNYEGAIFDEAKIERESYLRYFAETGIANAVQERTVLFDFVTGGTVQHYLSKMLGTKLFGICFATMNLPNDFFEENSADLCAAFGNIRSYGNDTALAKHYLFLEAILTDEKDTFVKFDETGEACFEGDGSNPAFPKIAEIHQGILRYAKEWNELYGTLLEDLALSYADQIYGELFAADSVMPEEIREIFYNDDSYDGVSRYAVF